MIGKYNIALLPATRSQDVINLSLNLSKIADQYKLGNFSLPHVTLLHFQYDENKVENVWKSACEVLPEKSINLEFKEFSCLTFNDTVFWVSLIPNQRDFLNKMHLSVANIIKASKNKSYDPHMTLINTKNKEYMKLSEDVIKKYSPISDKFVLSMGECGVAPVKPDHLAPSCYS